MPFTTYSGYVNEIISFLSVTNSDVTTAQANSLIGVTERDVNSVLRVRTMESALNVTVGSDGSAALPSDYVELKQAYINASPVIRPLKRATADEIYHKYPDRTTTAETECLIARNGDTFIFGPAAASGDVVKGIYYARPASMADTLTVQPTFSRYPQVYLYAALAKSEPFIGRDPRIQTWQAFFEQSLTLANGEDAREIASGGALQAQVT